MTHLRPIAWRKSSFSTTASNCVELAEAGDAVLMRDSKHPHQGNLAFTRAALAAFVAGAKAGEYDDLTGG